MATHEPAAVYLLCLDAACVAAGKGLPTTKRLGVGRGGDLNPQPLLKSQLRFQCGMALHSHHLEVLCDRGQMLPR